MMIKRDFWYTEEKKLRPLHIYLPEDYFESDEHYPVMYFFDGHNLFFNEDATYGKSWGLKEFLDTWNKKMIIVGIECGHGDGERLSEYMPFPARSGRFMQYEPKGDETLKWIVEEIKPMIDAEYRTMPFRECTGIAGSSMGGLMAIYGITHYNRWFSKGGCISSAIGFCMQDLMKDLCDSTIDPDTRAYLSWGTKEAWNNPNPNVEDCHSDTYKWNASVARQLNKVGATTVLVSQVGGGHCEADWEKLVPDFMDFLWMR